MLDLYLKTTKSFSKQLPFVIYSKPHTEEVIGIFQKNQKLHFLEDFSQSGFVFARFDSNQKSVFLPKNDAEVFSEVWNKETIPEVINQEASFVESDKKSFETLVTKMILEINKGEISKIVASRKEDVLMQKPDFFSLYKKIFSKYPNAFRYCFFHPQVGMWMGATPEKLLSVRDNVLQTMAYAATQKFEGSTDVIWHKKEQQEQQFVTDFIVENLKSEAVEVELSKPFTSQAGTLLHIRTDITARLKEGFSLERIINKLHPTPAVCGFPKDKAKQFILDNEGYDRSFYSGILGELNFTENKESELFVNLRCMEIRDQKVSFYIGCGITKDSNPEKEFFETVNKSVTMKSLF